LKTISIDGCDICLLASISCDELSERIDAECAFVTSASSVRQAEFHAGRNLARRAMQAIGHSKPDAILVAKDRLPIWPDGMVGSISHSENLVAVCLSRQEKGLGLDLEHIHNVSVGLVDHLLTPHEFKSFHRNIDDPTLYFCCKEAVFKALYPLVRTYFDFTDVQLSFSDNGFTASCSLPFADLMAQGVGSIRIVENHYLAVFSLAAD